MSRRHGPLGTELLDCACRFGRRCAAARRNTMTDPSTRSSKALRVAVIGLGRLGDIHARAIADERTLRSSVAICESDDRRAAGRRPSNIGVHGVPRRASGLLAAENRLTPSRSPRPTICTSAGARGDRRRLPCVLRKAVGRALGDAAQTGSGRRRARRVAGRRLQPPLWLWLSHGSRTLLDEGAIGRLDSCLIRVSDATPPPAVARHPHVIFTTLLTHHFDLMRCFGGEIRRRPHHGPESSHPQTMTQRHPYFDLCFATARSARSWPAIATDKLGTAEWMELGGTPGSIAVEDVIATSHRLAARSRLPENLTAESFSIGDSFYHLTDHVQNF